MSETIEVRCPRCKRKATSPRAEWDYPEAVLLEVDCPDCNRGDFDMPVYFDAAGDEVNYDPADIPSHRAQMAREVKA